MPTGRVGAGLVTARSDLAACSARYDLATAIRRAIRIFGDEARDEALAVLDAMLPPASEIELDRPEAISQRRGVTVALRYDQPPFQIEDDP